jgi:hypothetical protein
MANNQEEVKIDLDFINTSRTTMEQVSVMETQQAEQQVANDPQQEFFQNLNDMLELCVFSEGEINDKDLLVIADKYKEQYKVIQKLIDDNKALVRLALSIQQNPYYIRHTRTTRRQKFLTLEEKARSNKYHNCKFCDNIIKHTYAKKHYLNECCANNQLKKEVAKKGLAVHIKYNKATQLINMYIRLCLYDKSPKNHKRNGAYWKTIELMKYNYV